MFYNKQQELNILKKPISMFNTRKALKDFLHKYQIEYDKAKLNKVNIRKYRDIEELLGVI